MAADYFSYFLVVLFVKETKTVKLHFNMPDDNKDFNMQSHFKFNTVWKYCLNRDNACRSNNTNVCGVKKVNETTSYKDFKNGCYLFLSNMCDHPAEEYFIVGAGTCDQYISVRRSNESEIDMDILSDDEMADEANTTDTNSSENDTVVGIFTLGAELSVENLQQCARKTTDADVLRQGTFGTTKLSTLYEIDTSFDYHICPHSCPRTYSPVCVNVNRGYGKYFKLLTFVNHCSADVYYCKYWREFTPPPNEDESVRASPLAWSFCGASRYLQFARFAEAASSMGHYGWLAGDHKYSHIMEPHERIPGYGRKFE